MQRKYTALFLTIAILMVTFFISVIIAIFKPHQNISHADADYIITADSLYRSFLDNETIANQLFLNKIIEVTGIVTEINDNTLSLGTENSRINCAMKQSNKNKPFYNIGDTLRIKGVCTGMNLTDVCLSDCIVLTKK